MRIRIELFGMRLSVRYALQTKRFIGLIYYVWEIKELKVCEISMPLRSTTQPAPKRLLHIMLHIVAGVTALIT